MAYAAIDWTNHAFCRKFLCGEITHFGRNSFVGNLGSEKVWNYLQVWLGVYPSPNGSLAQSQIKIKFVTVLLGFRDDILLIPYIYIYKLYLNRKYWFELIHRKN